MWMVHNLSSSAYLDLLPAALYVHLDDIVSVQKDASTPR